MYYLNKAGTVLNYVAKYKRIYGITSYRFLATVRPCDTWPEWQVPEGYDTGIKVYNAAAKAKVPLITRNKGLLTWYMCGPTVYDFPHIGHGVCYMRFDIIRRILQQHFRLNIVQVMGITDIDDKIIAKAQYFKCGIDEVSRHFEQEFMAGMLLLGVQPPSTYVRVTEHIDDIVMFVQEILNKGLAYKVEDGSVYFNNVAYRKLRGLSVPEDCEDMDEPVTNEGNRILSGDFTNMSSIADRDAVHAAVTAQQHVAWEVAPVRKHPIDFALWKACNNGEPEWPAPFGPGRPGWHIECSAMACSVFGSGLDVHSGGVDLWFPHHYCEEAQSCARHSANMWTNYWWHSGHLTIDNEKMSKSQGNVIPITELLKTHSASTFRQFVLNSHIRKDVMYHQDILDNAAVQVARIQRMLDSCLEFLKSSQSSSSSSSEHDYRHSTLLQELNTTRDAVDSCLMDDFNTSQAMRHVLKLVTYTNACLGSGSATTNAHSDEEELLIREATTKLLHQSSTGRIYETEVELRRGLSLTSNVSQTRALSSNQATSSSQAGRSVPLSRYEIFAVRNYVLDLMQMFGMRYNAGEYTDDALTDGNNNNLDLATKFPVVMDKLVSFRKDIRNYALLKNLPEERLASLSKAEKKELRGERAELLQQSDKLRQQLDEYGVTIKDTRDASTWSLSEGVNQPSTSEETKE